MSLAMETGYTDPITTETGLHIPHLRLAKEQIQDRVLQLGHELATERYAKRGEVHVLTVLDGAAHFASDLRRSMQRSNPNLNVTSDQTKVSSYYGTSSGVLRFQTQPSQDVEDKHVLIVEDILESGKTLKWLVGYLAERNPASVEVAVAIDKFVPGRNTELLGQTALHVGFDIDPEFFLIGYGLDYDGRYRDLEDIYELKPIMPAQASRS